MTRRRLNQQQLRRISSKQQAQGRQQARPGNELPEQGEAELGPATPGLVICHYGQQLDIESLADDDTRGQVFRCFQRSNLPALVTGDRVVWHPQGNPESGNTGVVVALEERRSILSRPNAHGELRPVAANIDVLVITIAPLPEPFDKLIDRYLVAAETQGLSPLILLNKQDLFSLPRDEAIPPMLERYRRIGYPVLEVSTRTGAGLDALRQQLARSTAVFVGQSGVGKSSLINALRGQREGEIDAEVGALSQSHDKGTHTTTATRLYHLPGSGDLVDSPGIREFGLWHIDQQTLINGFVEFREFIGHCKFRDCSHQQDPGCALQQALHEGRIAPERLASYFHTLNTLNEHSNRHG